MDNKDKDKDKTIDQIQEYINKLTVLEKKAFEIAKNHLGTSFNINKSNGMKEWKK